MTYGVLDCYFLVTRGCYIAGTPYEEGVIVQLCGEDRDYMIGANFGEASTQEAYEAQQGE